MRKENIKTELHKFVSVVVDVSAGYLCMVAACVLVYLCCSKELFVILEPAMKEQNLFTNDMKCLLFYVSYFIYLLHYFIRSFFWDDRSFRKRSKPAGEESLCEK